MDNPNAPDYTTAEKTRPSGFFFAEHMFTREHALAVIDFTHDQPHVEPERILRKPWTRETIEFSAGPGAYSMRRKVKLPFSKAIAMDYPDSWSDHGLNINTVNYYKENGFNEEHPGSYVLLNNEELKDLISRKKTELEIIDDEISNINLNDVPYMNNLTNIIEFTRDYVKVQQLLAWRVRLQLVTAEHIWATRKGSNALDIVYDIIERKLELEEFANLPRDSRELKDKLDKVNMYVTATGRFTSSNLEVARTYREAWFIIIIVREHLAGNIKS